MGSTDEKLISECKEYWNSGLDIEQFPTLKEFLYNNSLYEKSFIYQIKKILEYITNKDAINKDIIYNIGICLNEPDINVYSNECMEAIKLECNGNLDSLNIEVFSKKYPEYYQELIDNNLFFRVYNCKIIEVKEFESIIKAVLPENLESDEVNEKIKRIKHFYALNETHQFHNGKSEEKLIQILSTLFNPDILFRQDKVGFSKFEYEALKKLIYIPYKLDNVPEKFRNDLLGGISYKGEEDYKKIINNNNFVDFIKFDRYWSFLYRRGFNENFEVKEDEINEIKELLNITKKYTIEQLSQIQIFQDFIINFINAYRKSEDNKGIDAISDIFETYLLKCNTPEDLLDKTTVTIMLLMNSEFLKEEDRNKLRVVYKKNYLSVFQEENESRKNEIKQKFPRLLEKVKNRASITAEELIIVKELACIERTTDGFFKDEYIDTILKFELERDINYHENNNLVKRLLEDKSQKRLMKNNIKDYLVITSSPDYFIDNIFKNTDLITGTQIGKIIMINEMNFVDSSRILIDILKTTYHETQHAEQDEAINSGKSFNFLIYDMVKESRLRDYWGEEYYEDNYRNISYEIDARIVANIKLVEYLQSLGINDEKIINAVQHDLGEDYELKETNLRKVKGYIKKESVDSLFQDIVISDQSILSDFEPFKIEFDLQTGTRKGSGEILLEYMQWYEENNLSEDQIVINEYADYYHGSTPKDNEEQIIEKANLYAHILNNESYVYDSQVIDDMLLLPKLMNTKSPKLRIMLEEIVKYQMLDVAYNYLKDGHIPEEVDMLTFVKAVSNLEAHTQYIENDELKEEVLQVVGKMIEKIKKNKEVNEIYSLGKIAQGATVGLLAEVKNVAKQFKDELEWEGKSNEK